MTDAGPGVASHRAGAKQPRPCVMVCDFGTTSLKVALVRDEEILAEADQSYSVSAPKPAWAEQDVDELYAVAGELCREVVEQSGLDPATVTSLVFVAPWKGIVPIDEAGSLIRPALIWLDGRASVEAAELNERTGRHVGTGQEYWPRLMWLKRHEPETWRRAKWLMGMVTYFNWRATGEVFCEPSDSFIHGVTQKQEGQFEEILEAAGLNDDRDKFAPVQDSTQVVGMLSHEAAAHFGIPAGTRVVGGSGDLPAITRGAGSLEPGSAHIYLGTSSWLAIIDREDSRVEAPLAFTIDADTNVSLYPLQTAGMAFDWIVRELYGHENAHLDEDLLARVNREVAQVDAGSEGLLATHWLNGELPPLSKSARGVFLNLGTHHDRRHMVRAMMESLCYTHRQSLAAYETASGERLNDIVCVGGGATSPVWMQMLADVLGRTVVVPEKPRYTGVIGGFRIAARGETTGTCPSSTASTARFDPRDSERRIYDDMFGHYEKIFPALEALFSDMNGKIG